MTVNDGATNAVTGGSDNDQRHSGECGQLLVSDRRFQRLELWFGSATCGSACAGGTLAGKFVTIAGTRQFTAIFTAYGLIGNITLHQSTIVQAQ